jgi:acyl-CoA synthetase (AMP-forming)/AMP-acid ligase II
VGLSFCLADLWEAVADKVPDRLAVVAGDRRLTYAELEARANRLAAWLTEHGVGQGDHVGLHLYNGSEYLEGMLAAYKIRAVPVNVNYRYVEEELRYLFDDADLVALVHDDEFTPRIAAIRERLPKLRTTLAVGDGYEEALAASTPERPGVERSGDDHYVIYTGGTTGMPKGVVWRQEDAFYSCFGGGDPMRLQGTIDDPAQIVERVLDNPFVFLPVAPLMHGAAQWTSLSWLFAGGVVVLSTSRRTDPQEIWALVERERANLMVVVGDAVARPLLEAYHAAPKPPDVSSLVTIGSGGAPLSPSLKEQLRETFPNVFVADGYGTSETGAQATNLGGGRFSPFDEHNTVLDEDTHEPVAPGSGVVGRFARRGHIPLAYYNDPEKTAATFVEAGGHRWVLTGDMATVLDDGSIQLLGRGSQCINTGGEKVYPEEVESALKAHGDVYDAVVVGVPDERWGERVTAVVQARPGATPSLDQLVEHCRTHVAGYKVPRGLVLVDEVVRSPVGKPDYRWARDVATAAEGT